MTDRSNEWNATIKKQLEILQELNMEKFVAQHIECSANGVILAKWKISFEKEKDALESN
jgi:hypothetical protein